MSILLYIPCFVNVTVSGDTTDYDSMVQHIATIYPNTKIICVGYSIGGNIITKYLGEKGIRIPHVIAGISAGQVYMHNQNSVIQQFMYHHSKSLLDF